MKELSLLKGTQILKKRVCLKSIDTIINQHRNSFSFKIHRAGDLFYHKNCQCEMFMCCCPQHAYDL